MGKKLKLREARRQDAARAVSAVLEAHSKHNIRPRAAERWRDLDPRLRAQVDGLRASAIRDPQAWRCRIKSRQDDRRFIDLVRFVFTQYSVPQHLENTWVEPGEDDFVDRVAPLGQAGGRSASRPDLRQW